MKNVNTILDIVGVSVSMLLIFFGEGDFSDYWMVYGWLFFSICDLIIRYNKSR